MNIIEKLGISKNFKRDFGDNIIRHGVKFSDRKHRYSKAEMDLIDNAPEMLDSSIMNTINAQDAVKAITNGDYTKAKEIILIIHARSLMDSKKATGKSWAEIKTLLEEE